ASAVRAECDSPSRSVRGPWSHWSTLPAGWRRHARDASAHASLAPTGHGLLLDAAATTHHAPRQWPGSIPAASTIYVADLVQFLRPSRTRSLTQVPDLTRALARSADFHC